jgi:hypothetical protein
LIENNLKTKVCGYPTGSDSGRPDNRAKQAALNRFLRLTLVFFYVLAQSAYGTFLLAHCKFQIFVDLLARGRIARPEQVEEKSGRLCQISENILYAGRKTPILLTIRHLESLDA